ncbi:MAG: paraquat-inducible protein A [Oleiphilaceae bacterium]|nr:paraquat-inducible protein A [Oleiphilaceae bacterium]
MTDSSDLIICEYCDSVYQRPPLARNERAHCQRCNAVIERRPWLGLDQLLALNLTAGMLLAFVSFYPILSVQNQGRNNAASLADSVWALVDGPISAIAAVVGASLILVPALQVTLLTWLLSFAHFRQRAPGFRWSMRTLEVLRPWSMLEVFLLGALVSVVKLTGRVEAAPAAGLFALAALTLLMIGIAGRDLRLLWKQVP